MIISNKKKNPRGFALICSKFPAPLVKISLFGAEFPFISCSFVQMHHSDSLLCMTNI